MNVNRAHVLVCGGKNCRASGSEGVLEQFHKLLKEKNLQDRIAVIEKGCFDMCAKGPVVVVNPEGTTYLGITPGNVKEIIEEHLMRGKPVKRLMTGNVTAAETRHSLNGVSFFQKQTRIALRNCGIINPEDIDEYIAFDGYMALIKVLTKMTPQEVIDVLKSARLRGRGGGGFPTGLKWQFAAHSKSDVKYVCCNADEGDPGAFMDRSLLEGDPHSLLEAMVIAGYAIGSNQGFVYIRTEYPVAVKRLETALEQARRYGLIGNNILGTGFNFSVDIRLGAGAFVCGEETALMTSIEGKRGEPRPRPPFPSDRGLFGKPTILNNVETFANIPPILLNGPEWFRSIGTERSAGTKVFAVGGNINNTGLVEIPMGTTLREIIYDIGGGIPGGKQFKAAQTGGPSGGCIPTEHLDVPIEYDTLIALGSMMGSGGLVVMDEDSCMVDIARFFLEFTVDESCGKCPPCRIGTKRMYEILEKIIRGDGEEGDIEKLQSLAWTISETALCGLGKTAPNPVLSTLRYFRKEYEDHIYRKICPAGVCKNLLTYFIIERLCRGCALCKKVCPVNAISGEIRNLHAIDQSTCIKCGACVEACPFKAIDRK